MINLGLTRIARLLPRLPTPQTWAAVHIAGTNGKGSIGAYMSSLFQRLSRVYSGEELRVGRFVSPHLIDRWDCITINDKPVQESLFLSVERQIQSLAGQVEVELRDHGADARVTEFELLTATAFEIFNQQKCQVAIIECGMGGAADATNVIDGAHTAVSIIAKIGLDHQKFLGNSIEDIARQKAGIAKRGVPVILDASNAISVKQVIKAEVQRLGASDVFESSIDQSVQEHLDLPQHQLQNLSIALAAYKLAVTRIREVKPNSTRVDRDLLSQVVSDVTKSHPGRLQTLAVTALVPSLTRDILLDGAHNPQSAMVLREYVDRQKPGKTSWIIGMTRGKELSQVLSILIRSGDTVTACPSGPVEGMPWIQCERPELISEAARMYTSNDDDVQIATDVVDALQMVSQRSGDEEQARIVVAGSLYLVSDLLKAIRNESGSMD